MLMNHQLKNITKGVSQQYEEARFETQVAELENCSILPAHGIRRRPSFTDSFTANTIFTTPNCKVFPLRYGSEEYTAVITPGQALFTPGGFIPAPAPLGLYGDSTLSVYNKLGTRIFAKWIQGSTNPLENIETLTIRDKTFILNKQKTVTLTSSISGGLSFRLISTPEAPASYPNLSSDANLYLNQVIYHIKRTDTRVISQKQENMDDPADATKKIAVSGSLTEGYDYSVKFTTFQGDSFVNNVKGKSDTRPGYTEVRQNTPKTLIEKIVTDANISYSAQLTATAHDDIVVFKMKSFKTVNNSTFTDSYGNQASVLCSGTIDSLDDMPSTLPVDSVVRVLPKGIAKEDALWYKFTAATGIWTEIADPFAVQYIDKDSMPIMLVHNGINSFSLEHFNWTQMTSGGGSSSHQPLFVGKNIKDIFFYQNRLGFITETSISLSAIGEYNRFYPDSITDVLDDDPIDIEVASKGYSNLVYGVPTDNQLVIFASDRQYTLEGSDNGLSPKTATLLESTRYEFYDKIKPTVVGDLLFFTVENGQYLHLMAYHSHNRQTSASKASMLSRHIPQYLPKTITSLEGLGSNGYLFMLDPQGYIYLFNWMRALNGEWMQQAFHRWTLPENHSNSTIFMHETHLRLATGTKLLDLDIGNTSDTDTTETFISKLKFSEFDFKDQNSVGTARGRTYLRSILYSVKDGSKFKTILTTINKASHIVPYTIEYVNDTKVTTLTETKTADITFTSDGNSWFELNTVNVELQQKQRSKRT